MYTKKYAKSLFGKGYGKLIDRLFKEVGKEHIDGIKPKYGRIDLYISGPEELRDIGYEIERESERTCEECGKPGEQKSINYWITTLCEKCYNKNTSVIKYKNILYFERGKLWIKKY